MKCSEETKLKMKLSHLGKKYKPMSIKGKINISLSKKGTKLSNVAKLNISKALKGKLPKNINTIKGWNRGHRNGALKKCLQCNKDKYHTLSDINRNKTKKFFCSPICQYSYFKGSNHSMYGKNQTEEMKDKIRGSNNHFWLGGDAKLHGYNREWTKRLKDEIRKRDDNTCQICKRHQVLLDRLLCIHHIDYNKHNCNKDNLIALCINCHGKTNSFRNEWIIFFNNLRNQKEVKSNGKSSNNLKE